MAHVRSALPLAKNVCTTHRCVSCCYDTEMMLLEEDITRIQGLGYEESFFTRTSEGFKVLKNSAAGRCVFHDSKQCTIYENRPKGCKLYPVVYDEQLALAAKDVDCPFRNEFNISRRSRKELSSIYSSLIAERSERSIQKSKVISEN
jgi:Fe-S-cluster containining protein